MLQNGDVLLTWIPPTDPANAFFSYEVYVSDSPTGPFAFYGPPVTAITTNTFAHTTTLTLNETLYYYVVTRSGPTGANSSISSDTLHTIHLNIFAPPGSVDIKLQYNAIHQPKLNSTSPTYTITKEYPIGTTNTLAVLSEIKYADTISVCHADINYQVMLMDNSGCVSKSNTIHGNYSDTYRPGGPNGPFVDSISVLPDGSTIIAWRIPRDMDITRYQIYYRETPTATITPHDQVPGRSSTSYTLVGNDASTHPIALFVAAIDSCSDDAGVYTINPITMLLTAKYNHCSYQTNLSWNKYNDLPGGILEYRIYYSFNGGPFSFIGNTTDTFFVHPGTSPGNTICYFVRVVNNSKTITASSNRACFFSTQVRSSNFVYMKTATVDSKTSVAIKLLLDTSATCNGINIFRSDNGSSYNNIGFVQYINGQPDYLFMDANAKTNSQSYSYKAVIIDSCGNSRTTSNLSKTIFLKAEEDNANIFAKHLSWSAYEGFAGGVNAYNIYRVINDVPAPAPVASTGTVTTLFIDDIEDEASQGAKIDYLVQAVEGPGNPYGIGETSNSNNAAVYMEGTLYIPNAFAPNGHNKLWMPVTHFIDKNDYSVTVFNRWGAKIFETKRDDVGWDGNNCMPDVYVYLVRYKDSFGEYKEVKGTVLLLE